MAEALGGGHLLLLVVLAAAALVMVTMVTVRRGHVAMGTVVVRLGAWVGASFLGGVAVGHGVYKVRTHRGGGAGV
jgi:hypothetical protein